MNIGFSTATAAVEFATPILDDALIEEAKPLMHRHWRELARNQDVILLEPNYALYKRASEAGMFVVYTVRGARLVGYAAYWVRPHDHYVSAVWAVSDLLIIEPEHRNVGIGKRFISFIEADLRARGVRVMHTTTKIEHPALGRLLVACGHERIEAGYSRRLF